jgi:hypothetical protein
MKIGELTVILDRVRQLYFSAGAKGPAKEFSTLAEALRPHADKSVDIFVATIERSLSQTKAKPKGRTKASAPNKPLNEDAIRRHVSQLRQAGTERVAFDRALDELKADKALKLADFAAIARQYSDSVTKYKSTASALQDISKAFIRQSRFENKLR